MISRSVLVGPGRDDLSVLAQALAIRPDDLLPFGADSDFGFFRDHRNAALFSPVDGDFAAACDVYIFTATTEQLHDALLWASHGGRRIAVPLEEGEPGFGPFSYRLYENGVAFTAEIIEDELLERLEIRHRVPVAAA